jgi:hypothetical protein
MSLLGQGIVEIFRFRFLIFDVLFSSAPPLSRVGIKRALRSAPSSAALLPAQGEAETDGRVSSRAVCRMSKANGSFIKGEQIGISCYSINPSVLVGQFFRSRGQPRTACNGTDVTITFGEEKYKAV